MRTKSTTLSRRDVAITLRYNIQQMAPPCTSWLLAINSAQPSARDREIRECLWALGYGLEPPPALCRLVLKWLKDKQCAKLEDFITKFETGLKNYDQRQKVKNEERLAKLQPALF